MITWEDAHRRAAVVAGEFHADLGIDLSRPVDPFQAIQRLQIVLAFGRLGRRVSGMYLPKGPDQPEAGIILHAGHPRTRQRYSAAHELGHYAFEHVAGIDGDLEALRRSDSGWTPAEKEAEAFGAWFLMPRRLVRTAMQSLGIERPEDPLDVYLLSLWLGTSYVATAHHLATIRILDGVTARRWARVQPRRIKQLIAGTMIPDDLRNDVWWVDTRRASHHLLVRPGDRIVVTVNEIPSSGYGWRVDDSDREAVPLLADSFFDDWEPEITIPSDDGELAGGTHARSFALAVVDHADKGEYVVRLVRDRLFEPNSLIDELNIPLLVDRRPFGLQLDAARLRIRD